MQNHRAARGRQGAHGTPYAVGFLQFGMRFRRALLVSLAALAGSDACAEMEPTRAAVRYSSLEAELATEYQAGDTRFAPSYVRLIGQAEIAITELLTAKAVVSPCAGPYSTQPEGVTQCSRNRLIEQLTLEGFGSNFDFSIGRQIVTVGNTEGFVLLDRFNGRDLCRFFRVDIQNKLPNEIARGRAFFGDVSVAATFAPFSGESEIPDPGSYCNDEFNDPGRFEDLDDPRNNSLADWAGGAELAVTRDRWSGTLNLISTREDLFVLETVPVFEKTRPRTVWLGGTVAATVGGIVLRGEVAYAPDRSFTLDPATVGGLLMRGIATDGAEQRWNLLTSVGLELRRDDWYWALQYFDDRVQGGSELSRDGVLHFASVRVRRTFANERFALDSFAVLDFDYQDLGIRAALTYDINDQTRVEVGGTVYGDFGNEPGLFGSYEGRESLFVKLRRAF